MKLVLASSSPRRAALLEQLGLEFEIVSPEVDESHRPEESPASYVERLARDKAEKAVRDDAIVIGADTVVVHQGRFMGKPSHPAEARAMLAGLAGSTHDVFTGLAVASVDQIASIVDVTTVEMFEMTSDEIARYVDGGEPMDKAGAYAIQGEGGRFVTRVEGSPSTVVGLPIHLLDRVLSRVGVSVDHFKSRFPV